MRKISHLFVVFAILACSLMLAGPVQAKEWLFQAPLYGPETDPTEAAYYKGSGGTVEVYKDATGVIWVEINFQTRPENGINGAAIVYDFSLEWGQCSVQDCYPPNFYPDWTPPGTTTGYMRDGVLLGDFVPDSKGQFIQKYRLLDFLPPHIVNLEALGFRVQPSSVHNLPPLPTPFATGFKAR